MKELQELRNEILTLRNYGVINKEEEKSLLTKLNNLKEQFAICGVVGSLPTEEERDLEKDRVRDIILKEIPDLDRVSFGAGFRACFGWFAKRYTK